MGKFHNFTVPRIRAIGWIGSAPENYRGWTIREENDLGFADWVASDGFGCDLIEVDRADLIAAIDAYEDEIEAARDHAKAHLAAMPNARRVQLEGEWAA